MGEKVLSIDVLYEYKVASVVVNVIKQYWRKSRISRFPPLAETARICHFKSNKQF